MTVTRVTQRRDVSREAVAALRDDALATNAVAQCEQKQCQQERQ
jgi:hypothetical protein